ncbi:MAG: hypothetical protein OEO84_15105 [Betaproteobacteria bacterium]|nr:hypothetical protein [Betaproteobacteria bacterium]
MRRKITIEQFADFVQRLSQIEVRQRAFCRRLFRCNRFLRLRYGGKVGLSGFCRNEIVRRRPEGQARQQASNKRSRHRGNPII